MNKTLLKLKIKKHVYEITSKDVFIDNGACVQLLTQSKEKPEKFTINKPSPVLSKRAIKEISVFERLTDLNLYTGIEHTHLDVFNLIEKDKKEYQSNAEWPPGHVSSMFGDNTSTDKHSNYEMAHNVCLGLKNDGLGGDGKVFPIKVWVS